jgi:two-component system sensor histidine kinase KdpD
MKSSQRPDPELLLEAINKRKKKRRGGKLYIFLGMAPGVGKTYSMLHAAHEAKSDGIDVVVGVVETHGRKDTGELTAGLEILPRKILEYRGISLEEMDLDAVLKRKPKLVLVDELAHTNVPGSRHTKRWQDVFELLDAGIDVLSTLNIQHLESRKEAIEQISGISVRETVPDSVLDRAFQIRLIDLSPDDLLKRLKEGKVYLGEKAELAAANFFKEEKLTALREIALRLAAEKVDIDLKALNAEHESGSMWQVSERLLVAVGLSKYSEQVIRATRRLASNLEAEWIAVYIDTGAVLSDKQKATLNANLELAKSLGAEILTVTDINLVDALTRIARQRAVTQIVVGRPRRRFVRDIVEGGSLLERLLRKSDIDVHILREEIDGGEPRQFGFFSPLARPAPFSDYLRTFWAVIAIAAVSSVLVNFVGYRPVGFVFLLSMLVLGLFVSLGPVLVAATMTALAWLFFFIPPSGELKATAPEDIFLCASYFVVALTTGTLTRRIRKNQAILVQREERSRMLYQVVRDIATSPSKDLMIAAVTKRLAEFLDGSCDIALVKKDGTLRGFGTERLNLSRPEQEVAVARWAFDNNQPAGWSTETLQLAQALYVPLKGPAESVGVLAYCPREHTSLSAEDKDLILTVGRQIAVSLERETFRERSLETQRFEEIEKLHRTIMELISDEIKSPLGVISQAAGMLAGDEKADPEKRHALSLHLFEAIERLNFAVDNLVAMSRLNNGIYPLNKKQSSIKKILEAATSRIPYMLEHHRIIQNVPTVLEAFAEPELIERALVNIIVNAALYSPKDSRIQIDVLSKGSDVEIKISDEGPGIPDEHMGRIFEKFYRVPGTPGEGLGLGLSVAKGVVRAHGGKLSVANRQGGGSQFTILLPVESK